MPCSFVLNLTVCGMFVLHVHMCFFSNNNYNWTSHVIWVRIA